MRMVDLFPFEQKIVLGTRHFNAEDIIRFATKFDPQPFHVDAEAAKSYVFGGLCASGWHTCSVWMRTFLDFMGEANAKAIAEGVTPPRLGPSPGFTDLKWLKPVYAGDDITYSLTAQNSRALRSRPGWHLHASVAEGMNQQGEPVLRFVSTVLEQENDNERS
ncbi:MaoC family dehydratase [Agrobacterium vitis]|uniref:MaoC family dehydratase n=1 Tax=Agrobacterium vitis TaxID=373 RepID=UPI0012E9632A|nr:MaoC family dehydratase [Agrobacterium vitis]MVA72695.1 dehydratase [Agrobacterium vitis]